MNLPAVLIALAEETEAHKYRVAKGLYGFCCTYRFIAAALEDFSKRKCKFPGHQRAGTLKESIPKHVFLIILK